MVQKKYEKIIRWLNEIGLKFEKGKKNNHLAIRVNLVDKCGFQIFEQFHSDWKLDGTVSPPGTYVEVVGRGNNMCIHFSTQDEIIKYVSNFFRNEIGLLTKNKNMYIVVREVYESYSNCFTGEPKPEIIIEDYYFETRSEAESYIESLGYKKSFYNNNDYYYKDNFGSAEVKKLLKNKNSKG